MPPAPDRPPLTRDLVLDRALALADAEGLSALSMRKLARALGVEAMSLYHHVANKEDLLDGLVERVAAEFESPAVDADWRTALRRRAHGQRAALLRHPWATQLIVSRVNVGPAMLSFVDATIGCLRAAGFPVPLADHAWNALDSFVYGFVLQEHGFPFEPDEYADAAAEYLPQLPPDELPHLREMAEHVQRGEHDGRNSLDFGLELLLDGLERRLAGV